MRISPRNLRIAGASLLAILMVVGGYVLPGFRFPETKAVNAELTDELLASYVAKDTDSDGLPDWQEVLYGTDENKADTDGDGVSDGEAVRKGLLTPTALAPQVPLDPIGEEDIPGEAPAAGSFTERFSRSFFEEYLRASGGQPMDPEAQQTLTNNLLGKFTREAAQSLGSTYTLVSIRTDASVSAASYAGSVEFVLESSIPDSPDSDMLVLAQKLIENGDDAAEARLDVLSQQYARAVTGLLAVPVPPSLAPSHLQLIRGLQQAGRAAKGISVHEKDPLLTMGALAVLLPARNEIMQGLGGIAQAVLAGGEPAPGAPGALIVNAVRREQQQ